MANGREDHRQRCSALRRIGPVPVPPSGPFDAYTGLSPGKRDVLVGLALTEMANLINDGQLQQEVRTVGLKLVKQAANQLQVPIESKDRPPVNAGQNFLQKRFS
jgi:hypothetical protein